MKTVFTILILFTLTAGLRAQDSVTSLAGQALVSGASNGTGTNALFSDPAAIVVDAGGNIFVADSQNHAIRKITTNGVVTTFAGQMGVPGTKDDTGTNAQFNLPCGLALDAGGNLFVSDTGNNAIRKITPAGVVSTIAGVAGTAGFGDGPTGIALFSSPLGIIVATNGTIFVADSGNQVVRAISGGQVSTFAGSPGIWGTVNGTGTNAQFNGLVGLALDPGGNLFVSDANNDTIRKVTAAGAVTTYAGSAGADGSADGPLNLARFRSPAELVFDQHGNLFVADSFNQTIREISAGGMVSTVTGMPGTAGASDGVNGAGRFFNPYGLAAAPDGSILMTDTYNELVRVVLVPFKVSTQVSATSATVTISWNAVIGKTYQVQYADGLSAAWTNLGLPVTATNLNLNAVDVFSVIHAPRLYRILINLP